MPDRDDLTTMDIQDFADLVGKRLGVPKWFSDAIFHKENIGHRIRVDNPRSPAGAIGPGQLMPGTAKMLGVNPYDPVENVIGSLKLQKQLLDKYNKFTADPHKAFLLAAAAYNAGEGAVDKRGDIPNYKETLDYVDHVAKAMRQAKDSGTFQGGGSGVAAAGLGPQPRPQQKRPQKQGGIGQPAESGIKGLPEIPKRPTVYEAGSPEAARYAELRGRRTPSSGAEQLEELRRLPLKPQETQVLVEEYQRQGPGLEPFWTRAARRGVTGDEVRGSTKPSVLEGPSLSVFTPEGSEAFKQAGMSKLLAGDLRTLAQSPNLRFGSALGALPEEHRVKFLEGVTSWVGRTAKTTVDVLQTIEPKDSYLSQYLLNPAKSGGEFITEGARRSALQNKATNTFTGELAAATGYTIPELVMFSKVQRVLGAATLPTVSGAHGFSEEGAPGLVKGVGMGMVYHYGGGLTGKYMGKVGNTLVWVGAPAAEDHLVNGTPLSNAIAGALPMGAFAGWAGSNRVHVFDKKTGNPRPARLRDIPALERGKLTVLEPQQVVSWKSYEKSAKQLKAMLGRSLSDESGFVRFGRDEKKPQPYFGLHYRDQVYGDVDTPARSGLHGDVANIKGAERWRYEPKTKTVYWSGDTPPERGTQFAIENWLERRGQEVQKHDLLANYRVRDFREEGGFVGTGGEDAPPQAPIARFPKQALPSLIKMGAFHYEAGNRSFEDWYGRMLKSMGETTDTVSPEAARQLGEVYAQSKRLYDESVAPTFFSGLRQTIVELRAGNKIGDKVKVDRLVNLLKQSGQTAELEASGLLADLSAKKKEPIAYKDLLDWLDTKGMTMDVLRGETSKQDGWDRDREEIDGGVDNRTGINILPGVSTRAPYVQPGGRDYFEGVVGSNKAMDFSMDDAHFGIRPDQISWYRGQLVGGSEAFYVEQIGNQTYSVTKGLNGRSVGEFGSWVEANEFARQQSIETKAPPSAAKLEEVQSKREQRARERGLTEDPNNSHARLIALGRESDLVFQQLREAKMKAGDDDPYFRYTPDEGYDNPGSIQAARDVVRLQNKLEKLQEEINHLEAETDRGPVPWAPHLSTWYEPALKGFLREAALRLEPDRDGNVHIVTTSASEQSDRYSLRKYVESIEWTKNPSEREIARRERQNAINTELGTRLMAEIPVTWDVQVTIKEPSRTIRTFPNMTEKQLRDYFGEEVADRVINNQSDPGYAGKYVVAPLKTGKWAVEEVQGLQGRGVHDVYGSQAEATQVANELNRARGSLKADSLPVGGKWAVKLYGDTAENIRRLWPNHPELEQFAWKESGNKAIVPAWMEKYFRAWGGKVGVKGEPLSAEAEVTGVDARTGGEAIPPQFTATMPEIMRDAILKHGQLFFGRRLPELPSGKEDYYAVRNRLFTRESYEAHAAELKKKLKLVYNPITGQRIPNPRRGGGGFINLAKPVPTLDLRASTDISTRQRDPDQRGLFSRLTRNHYLASPVRRLLSFDHPVVDKIEARLYDAKLQEHDHVIEFGRRFGGILELLDTSLTPGLSRSARKGAKQTLFNDFIDLIEKDFADPSRDHANPMVKRALEEYDKLTRDAKIYLMESYAARGQAIRDSAGNEITDPDAWGITAHGFFRHMYSGDNNVFLNGNWHGNFKDYAEAVIEANKILDADPSAKVEIKARPFTFIDPSTRTSTRNYERLVEQLVGNVNQNGTVTVGPQEIRSSLRGSIGKKENINKFFASSMKREYGQKAGMSRDFEKVMQTYFFQLARSQELSKLRKDITPDLEELNRLGLKGVVQDMERQIDDLWGKPLRYEQSLSSMMAKVPGLLKVAGLEDNNQALAFQGLVRKITTLHNVLKLRGNPKAIFINDIQPLRTLWPYMGVKDMVEVARRMHDPKWKNYLADLGVAAGTTKLETGTATVQRTTLAGAAKKLDFFTYVSGLNRQRGFTAGHIVGERNGLSGFDLYRQGMRWADHVEFDNSMWNAPQVLRHAGGQLFGQYKGFLIKDIENAIEVWQGNTRYKQDILGMPPDRPFVDRPLRGFKWLTGTAVAGGARASLSPLPWISTAAGFSIYLQTAALIKALTGTDEKTAKFYASMVYLGPPAAAGLDISSSVTPIDEPPGFTPFEKFTRFFAGPTVTGAYDISTETRKVLAPSASDKRPFGERVFGATSKATPYARMGQRAFQLGSSLATGKTQYTYIDQHAVPLTRTQMLFGTMGVPASHGSLYYEEKEATRKSPLRSPGVPPRSPFAPLPLSRFKLRENR